MIKLAFGRRDVHISKFSARIIVGVLWFAILSGAGFLVYLGLDSYDKARSRLGEQATSYAHLIAEHDRFGFTLADVILKDMLDYLTWNDFNGTITEQRRAQVLEYLKRHKERMPGIASFTVVGADGIRRIGAVGEDFTNLSHRGYYKALRDGRDSFISNVEDGRASGKPGIHVARRFGAPDGTFGGVLVMNLAAEDVFFSFYKSLNLGKNYGTTLRDPQRILISFPKYTLSASPLQGRDVIGDQLAAGRDRGVLLTTDPSDGLEKLTAFERLEGTNIFATASLPMDDAMAESRWLAVGALLSAIACILGALGATSAIVKAHALAKARDEAVKAGTERKMLIRKLNTVVENERKIISIEIHDVLNAMLVRVRLDSQGILGLTSRAKPDALIEEIAMRAQSITKNANAMYEQARGIVTRLRPEVLDVLGIEQAIDEMVSIFNRAHPNCHFAFNASGDMAAIESSVSIAAYRLVQEALSNVVKHSEASEVSVSVKVNQEQKSLDIAVADDGVGFDSTGVTLGLGVVGMRERVAALNGRLNIRSGINTGTEITASIPLGQDTSASSDRAEAQAP
jgi:signal transduction histidine kinase